MASWMDRARRNTWDQNHTEEGPTDFMSEFQEGFSETITFEGAPKLYYKLVAEKDGRFYSIYDGTTEYAVGRKMSQPVRDMHGGGYYVAETLESLLKLGPFPKGCALKNERWMVSRVKGWGQTMQYGAHKIAVEHLEPLSFRPFPYDKSRYFRRPRIPSSVVSKAEPPAFQQRISLRRNTDQTDDRIARTRARTMSLEDEVREMEDALRKIREARG